MNSPTDWQSLEFIPNQPPQRPGNGRTWLWIAVGTAGLLLCILCGGVALYLLQQSMQQGKLGSLLADQSERSPLNSPAVVALREGNRQSFAKADLAGPGVLPPDIDMARQAIDELTAALSRYDQAAFTALIDTAGFAREVQQSGHLSITGRMGFREQFSDWMVYEIPFYCRRQKLVHVRREPGGRILVSCWADRFDTPEPVVWIFIAQQNRLRLIDYFPLNDGIPFSVQTAREFSAAFTDAQWDAYTELINTTNDGERLSEAELDQLTALQVPDSVRYRALTELVSLANQQSHIELCLKLSEQAKAAGAGPVIDWQRATCLKKAKRYAEALEALRTYQAAVGACPFTLAEESSL
ncbi:MAG: hypothetical protein KDA85_05540, partial [Planctomycetaceae bacterium]|nr:hypothetical protein [Planctomycetaceae bacterium]